MSSGTIAALRAKLNAARNTLLPQLQGYKDFVVIANLWLSSEAREEILQSYNAASLRLANIDETLSSLDDLEADGYPSPLTNSITPAVRDELLAHQAAIAAAMTGFYVPAISAIITMGTPVDK